MDPTKRIMSAMTDEADLTLPEAALATLRDLVESLEREKIKPHIEYLPNGNIRCMWLSGAWAVSSTITPHWQIVKFVALKGGT